MNTNTLTCPSLKFIPQGYEFLLAVTKDSLVIISREEEILEWVVKGIHSEGVILEADSEDQFLDAINAIKLCISVGDNPLLYVS